MKVCMVTTGFPRYRDDFAGSEVYSLAKSLVHKGIPVVVIAPHTPNTRIFEIVDGINVHRFKYMIPERLEKFAYGFGIINNLKTSFTAKINVPFFMISFFLATIRMSRNVDIIHAHWMLSGLIAIFVGKINKKPTALTVHGTGLREFPQWLSRLTLKKVDKVISPHMELTEIARQLGRPDATEIHNIIDEHKFNNSIDTSKLKQEFNIEDEMLVTFVGRLYDFRDPLTFVKSIPYVLKKHSNVKWVIVGDGVLRHKIIQMAKKLKIDKALILTGFRTDVNAILNASTIFTAVSPYENLWCKALVEPMMVGIPCIVTKVGSAHKILTHKKDAYLIPPLDEKKLAEATIELLENRELRKTIVDNASRLIEKQCFSKEYISRATIELYRSLI